MSIIDQQARDSERTLSAVLTERKTALLEAWMRNILTLPGNRTLSLMTERQLRGQAGELLDALLAAFKSGNLEDIQTPEYRVSSRLLRMISESRAKQGFSPTETAVFVFSLKDAFLPILQKVFDSDRTRLASEVIRLSTVIDKLGLVTFESYVDAREKVITKQSRAMVELAESANRAKNLFLASMSHEIRTPIQAITGMGELLMESALSREDKKQVEIINRAGESLLALVNDILDLSKIEAGQFELERQSMSLHGVVENTARILTHRAKDKGLRLTWEVKDEVPELITGDPNRLRQVLLNLVGNAIKFTSSGDVHIQANARKGKLQVSVSDTGIGIAEEQQEIIFEPFTQSNASASRQHGGTGLGLAICRQLVEMMGGRISVDSLVGKGSTFHIEWPLEPIAGIQRQKGKADPSGNLEGSLPQSSTHNRSRKILLAEDTPENRLVIQAFLKSSPWQVDFAKDGSEALLKFIGNPYDLVLMDVEMPIMDGYAATRAIRGWECQHDRARTPIIALTAHAMREHRERSLEAGCDGHLIKPIRKDRLIQSVQTAFKKAIQTKEA